MAPQKRPKTNKMTVNRNKCWSFPTVRILSYSQRVLAAFMKSKPWEGMIDEWRLLHILPLSKVRDLHHIQTKWNKLNRRTTDKTQYWYKQGVMQALQPRPIHLRKTILSVRPELNIKLFRSHTILMRGTGWLVRSQQTTTTYFKNASARAPCRQAWSRRGIFKRAF